MSTSHRLLCQFRWYDQYVALVHVDQNIADAYIIKFTIGVRVTPEEEIEGMDLSEIGMEAYPDFRK